MRKKSKSAVKKSSHKKVIDAGFDSKTETSNNGLTNDTFDSDLLSSQDSDKISSFSSQDNLRFLVEEPIANEFSQEALSNFPTIVSAKTYIFVQLKLISVDSSCLYDRLENNCLCISSDACASHIKTFIYKKMNVSQSLYDVVLMCNGYEIKSKCPISILKNNFFANKSFIDIYYAIVECKSDKNKIQ